MGRTTLKIIAEATGWLAADKPAGTVVVPAPGAEESLWRALERERDEQLWAVHRLDRGTSGVVLFARDAETHRELSMAFEHAKVRKTYLVFVHGTPLDGTIEVPLHAARRGRTRPAEPAETEALDAQTDVHVVETWNDAALVEARPRTGRHHQIRVHLKSVGAPLLVDPIYAPPATGCAAELPTWRLTLHAHRLELGAINVESPMPDDLSALRKCLASAGRRLPPSG